MKYFLIIYLIQIHIWTLRPPSPMFLHNLLITVVTVALKPCKPMCVCTRVCNSQRLDRNCHNLTFSCKANFFFSFWLLMLFFISFITFLLLPVYFWGSNMNLFSPSLHLNFFFFLTKFNRSTEFNWTLKAGFQQWYLPTSFNCSEEFVNVS